MCQHHAPSAPPVQTKRAIALADGVAHAHDHAAWSRRDFLTSASMGAAAVGATLVLGGRPVHAASNAPLLRQLAGLDTDRTLVVIQMAGGNDGLNTVVPITNDLYYQRRPTIALPASQTMALSTDYGLNGTMAGLAPLWGEGHMAVVHAVGYPQQSLSHFRGTDIWASASDADETRRDGWTGRYFDTEYPDYPESPPDFPVAIRIGGASSLLVRGADTAMGMSFSDAGQFERLAETGQYYDENSLPATPFGQELGFVRSVYNAAFRYRDAVVNAADAATNAVEYPDGGLAENLAIVARLIKGGLGARLYVVQHGSFDTHAGQVGPQGALLGRMADSVAAFYADLSDGGRADDALTMTFSEFGRRVEENGSAGTDHGTASPLFVFGGGVNGGLYGQGPDLGDLDGNGNLHHTTDFRQVYASVLRYWFGLDEAATAGVLGGGFSPLDLVSEPVANEPTAPAVGRAVLEGAYPNPFAAHTTTAFTLDQPGRVRLSVLDTLGREVRLLASGPFVAGRHTVPFIAAGLPSGTYLLRLDTAAGTQSRRITLVR